MTKKDNKIIKLTFTGDIMSLLPQDKASLQPDETYDYSGVFKYVKPLLQESDLVCANLETVFGGPELQYTSTETSFNTPDEFVRAVKDAGITVVTTANNHCLDRGVEGLKKTLDLLDKNGLEHTGTYRNEQESEEILMLENGGLKIAIVSYTYGTNSEYNGCFLPDGQSFLIDLLKKQAPAGTGNVIKRRLTPLQKVKKRLSATATLLFPNIIKQTTKRLLPFVKQQPARIVIDNVPDSEINNPLHEKYLERLIRKIEKAKKIADYTIVSLHIGGQYNNKVGSYTQYIMDLVERQKVDLVIGNHPHCVLRHKVSENNRIITHSLGNFCFTPNWGYWVNGVYAEYSIMINIYLDKETKSLSDATFTVLKTVTDTNNYSSVYPLYDLIRQETDLSKKRQMIADNREVVKRFCGSDKLYKVAKEYPIENLGNNKE